MYLFFAQIVWGVVGVFTLKMVPISAQFNETPSVCYQKIRQNKISTSKKRNPDGNRSRSLLRKNNQPTGERDHPTWPRYFQSEPKQTCCTCRSKTVREHCTLHETSSSTHRYFLETKGHSIETAIQGRVRRSPPETKM